MDVVAIGTKGAKIEPKGLAHLRAPRWLLALDADADEEADVWREYSGRVKRIRPLVGNDLTDMHNEGGDLRAWIEYHLESDARLDAIEAKQRDNEERLGELIGGDDEPGLAVRYQVNVMVHHEPEDRAPVIYEDNPTYVNLVGRVEHLARSLRAARLRIEKLDRSPERDRQLSAEVRRLSGPFDKHYPGPDGAEPELEHFRWLLEELRVSLFAQELGTSEPVSPKRLEKRWREIVR